MDYNERDMRRRRRARRKRKQRQQLIRRLAITAMALCLMVGVVSTIRFLFSRNEEDTVSVSNEQPVRTAPGTDHNGTVSGSAASVANLSQPVEVDPNSVIYFTFDDGPSSEVTPAMLDLLEQNEIPATFFILDYTEDKVPLLQRMVADGDTIGLHAWSHDYEACYSDDDSYLSGINDLRQKVLEDTGYTSFCIRFPGGSSNTISRRYNDGVMTRLTAKVEEDDSLEYYDWNADSTDATGNNIDSNKLAENAISELVKGRNNVILFHDTNNKTTSVEAVQLVINYARANGYCFAAIQPDTPAVHHGVNN